MQLDDCKGLLPFPLTKLSINHYLSCNARRLSGIVDVLAQSLQYRTI